MARLPLLFALAAQVCITTCLPASEISAILPASTAACVSVPDVAELSSHWKSLQLCELLSDPQMKPFVADLQGQLRSRLLQTGMRMGIELSDLNGVVGGEFCIALLPPAGHPQQHCIALLADISEHRAAAEALIAKVSRQLEARGATRTASIVAGTPRTSFRIPGRLGERPHTFEAHYQIVGDRLIVSDHQAVITQLVNRVLGARANSLAEKADYVAIAQRCRASEAPDLNWYVNLFEYGALLQASREARGENQGMNVLELLRHQGFTAVKAVGGQVLLADGEHEIQHRSFVFAPGAAQAATRFQQAARMLQLTNDAATSQPLPWLRPTASNHLTLNLKTREAFEACKSLVDEIAGDPIFDDIMESIAKDVNGPRVDIRRELIAHLGDRITFATDHHLPIGPECERYLIAVETRNATQVSAAMDRLMSADPSVRRLRRGKLLIWEIVKPEEPQELVKVEVQGFGGFGQPTPPPPPSRNDALLPNVAITVANGHLVVGSHVDYLVETLGAAPGTTRPLCEVATHQRVQQALANLGAGNDCAQMFTCLARSCHPSYEMIRQGRMPESKSPLGQLLNMVLGPKEPGAVRQQEIDGSKMPAFEAVSRYLGPAGLFVQTEADGWLIRGCVLRAGEAAEAK